MSKHDTLETQIFLAKFWLICLAIAILIALVFEILLAFSKAWISCSFGAVVIIASLMMLAEMADDLRGLIASHQRFTEAMRRIEFDTAGQRFGRRSS
ncbi:hypothetical protein IMW82_14690 [Rhodanobacter sp. B2A1Ga4]|jgi:hypothetical protein|uniref:hypothetical protein n=1 Tax=Rhodanobacter sp. B2A1Ga4 TaxID=2778647 RepID=UPI001B369C61|nr:hypothetical protein [Rhodanobacter sp. B2A1Ga4]MBQ4855915.1 hypothetical protein [Rhodanobacter sp. B2A1Ga4]